MGIDVQMWRIRIGLFGRTVKTASVRQSPSSTKSNRVDNIIALSLIIHMLLLLSGQVELNPGPESLCPQCKEEVLDDDCHPCCENCSQWFHLQCLGIEIKDLPDGD